MKKRIISAVCAAAMIVSAAAVPVSESGAVFAPAITASATYSGKCGDNCYYDFDSSTGTLTISGTGDMYETNISYVLSEIRSDIKTAEIKNGVTSIGVDLFYCCKNLSSVTIPGSVTSIGGGAFSNCTNLTSLIIPNGVKSIGDYAFYECKRLTEITIPNSVTSIGISAFYSCTSLTEISIPDSVNSLDLNGFYKCDNLESIKVGGNNKNYSSYDGVLYNKKKTELLRCPYGKTSVIVSDGVISIRNEAFSECRKLKEITMPDTITDIGESSFFDCTNLTCVTIPDGVTSIGANCFLGCTNIAIITFPVSLVTIYESAFLECDNLRTIKYKGTYKQWEKIVIGLNNRKLLTATKYYLHFGEPHTYYKSVKNKPTCIEEGTYEYRCTCGDSYTEPIPALGHDYSTEWTIDREPACTSPGKKSHHCTRCYDEIDATEIPAKGHSWRESSTAPTCTEDGRKYFICSVCEYYYTETIPATGHNYTSKVVAPTCTEHGYTEHTCSNCGASYKDNDVPPYGHSYIAEITKASTCTETGIMTCKCSCGDSYTVAIPALGHDYSAEWTIDVEPTCTTTGVKSHHCSRCGEKTDVTEIPATGHTWDSGKVTKAATCTKSGEKLCTCTKCGETHTEVISALGHDYSAEWTIDVETTCTTAGSKSHHCSRCEAKTDVTEIPATGHKFVDKTIAPTYDADGYTEHTCSVCGYSYKDNYTPKKERTDISKATVTVAATTVYTGKALKPNVTVKLGGKTLKSGTNYTASYKSNTNCGKATITITGKGDYTGTKTASFIIKPAKATISSVKSPKTKQVKVTWKKSAGGVSGYEVLLATNNKFTKGKKTVTITSASTSSKTITKLKKGTTYYAKLRAYKTIGKKKYYGAWSAVKSVKCK